MRPRTDERGLSISVMTIVIMGAMIAMAGLVIDGGQKLTATSRAETAAAGASRVAGNAAATEQLGGQNPAGAAVLAARAYLAGQPGVSGSVSVASGIVSITTTATEPTIFLNAIGIESVTGRGQAEANVVATGEQR